jgi:phenylacetate-CoA ligase
MYNGLDRFRSFLYDQFTTKSTISIDAVVMLLYYNNFIKTYKFLKKSQNWNEKQIKFYQEKKLKELLNHAYQNVPFYSKLFDDHCIKLKDIKSLDDLKKIPMLTKEMVRLNSEDFISKNYPKHKLRYLTTGGSTGKPLGFYVTKGVWDAEQLAYAKMIYDEFGCNLNDKFVILRGYLSKYKDKKKFYEYSLFGKSLILFPYYIDAKNMENYVKKIRDFNPKFIITFPSIITILARYMQQNNLEPFSSVKVISCSSELLEDFQKKMLEDFFHCKVINTYGHAESAVLATTCKKSNYLHCFPEYGIVELVDKNGEIVDEEGKQGEIVATGFYNFIFPFIRYKTGDIGIFTNVECECGRNYQLIKKVSGRYQDYVISKNNKIYSSTDVFQGLIANSTNNVIECQMIQYSIGEIVLKIVKNDKYSDKDEKEIKNKLFNKFGDEFDVSIEYVDTIPCGRWGRHKFFIQKLSFSIEDVLCN